MVTPWPGKPHPEQDQIGPGASDFGQKQEMARLQGAGRSLDPGSNVRAR